MTPLKESRGVNKQAELTPNSRMKQRKIDLSIKRIRNHIPYIQLFAWRNTMVTENIDIATDSNSRSKES
jgi:hypothetical protein